MNRWSLGATKLQQWLIKWESNCKMRYVQDWELLERLQELELPSPHPAKSYTNWMNSRRWYKLGVIFCGKEIDYIELLWRSRAAAALNADQRFDQLSLRLREFGSFWSVFDHRRLATEAAPAAKSSGEVRSSENESCRCSEQWWIWKYYVQLRLWVWRMNMESHWIRTASRRMLKTRLSLWILWKRREAVEDFGGIQDIEWEWIRDVLFRHVDLGPTF